MVPCTRGYLESPDWSCIGDRELDLRLRSASEGTNRELASQPCPTCVNERSLCRALHERIQLTLVQPTLARGMVWLELATNCSLRRSCPPFITAMSTNTVHFRHDGIEHEPEGHGILVPSPRTCVEECVATLASSQYIMGVIGGGDVALRDACAWRSSHRQTALGLDLCEASSISRFYRLRFRAVCVPTCLSPADRCRRTIATAQPAKIHTTRL